MLAENRFKLIFTVFQPAYIGQDQIDAGAAVHIRKGHPQIDQNQPFFTGFPIAIDIGIHANFTGAAKGQVDQSFTAHSSGFSYIIFMNHGQPVHG